MDEKACHDSGPAAGDAAADGLHIRASRIALAAAFEELNTQAWRTVPIQDRLPGRIRSLVTLAMMAALGRDDEFKLQVRIACYRGVTPDQIKEVLLQTAIHCGVPVANHAFELARMVLEDPAALD